MKKLPKKVRRIKLVSPGYWSKYRVTADNYTTALLGYPLWRFRLYHEYDSDGYKAADANVCTISCTGNGYKVRIFDRTFELDYSEAEYLGLLLGEVSSELGTNGIKKTVLK